jgi:hypothetical protein
MNSDLLARWTAIITNIAIVMGLVFVGLEFRNNSRSIEAERIDSFTQGVAQIQSMWLGSDKLSEIIYQSYADPETLTGSNLDRLQHMMFLYHSNFKRMYLAHQAGLISDDMYALEKSAIGFVFSSEAGLDIIDLMQESALSDESWSVVSDSAMQAQAYCLNPENRCAARYEAARNDRGTAVELDVPITRQ